MNINIKEISPEAIQEAIDTAINSGELDKSKMIYYKVDEENLSVEVSNSQLSSDDLNIKPGAVELPTTYTNQGDKTSMADDPIYSQALEMHWGF